MSRAINFVRLLIDDGIWYSEKSQPSMDNSLKSARFPIWNGIGRPENLKAIMVNDVNFVRLPITCKENGP